MERYFIVTEESSLHKDWFAYKENREKVIELYKQFTEQVGIESREYHVTNKVFYIVPTENDSLKFQSFLCKPLDNGLCKFKASSKIAKGWIETLKRVKLEVLSRPMVILYFSAFGGRYNSRLFDYNGLLYCSLDPCKGEALKGFIEIKASEFYKIIEEAE